ncbi:MAG TPA: hypothetical protein VGE31_02115 [Candidatus Paceibacterota bacterium]
MSTHRKIEWALFIVGLIGFGVSLWLGAEFVQTILLGVGTLFAGLHAFKLYDGHKSNHVVVATSLLLIAYAGYVAFISDLENLTNGVMAVFGILLSILSLRLRQDFHKK